MYRVGLPGWKIAARLGVPVLIRVRVHYDEESKSYWADSPDLDGLTVAGSTLDELQSETLSACDMLLSLYLEKSAFHATTRLMYQQPVPGAS
jgi:predicted RNase H-like HicB family nuclease